MRNVVGRRRPKASAIINEPPPPPQPTPIQVRRDSDGSFCSSRPSPSSSVALGRSAIQISDRSYQLSAIRAINSFLSSHSLSLSLKPPLPSAKDITETLRFVLSRLDFPSSNPEEDIPYILKWLGCPIKISKSALRAPGTPHAWPSMLAVLDWLVQVAIYGDYVMNSSTVAPFSGDLILDYALEGYTEYIEGKDYRAEEIDMEFQKKLEEEKNRVVESTKCLEKEEGELSAELERLRTAPSLREEKEKEKALLEQDVKKFQDLIQQIVEKIGEIEPILEQKERKLSTKEEEKRRMIEENEELKKRVDSQTVNPRDAERMKKELFAVERDINEAELGRNSWEEKAWDSDSTLSQKLNELETLAIECNQAVKRLKFGNDFQYVLNPRGSTAGEVLGSEYKWKLKKPVQEQLLPEMKQSSMEKLEELISLQQISTENNTKIESKRNQITVIQSRIDDFDEQMSIMKKEANDYASNCAINARIMIKDVELEEMNMDTVEKDASEYFEIAGKNLQQVVRETEEQVQKSADQLFLLVDSVSKHKEHVSSKICSMNTNLSEAAEDIARTYRGFLSSQM